MLFGLPAVIERTTDNVFTSTLGYAWHACGGENFVIQAGRAGDLQLPHCERLFRSLVAFLHHTGIVTGLQLAAEDQDAHYFPLGQTAPLISEHAGLFVSHVSVGAWLQAGDLIGYVYDAFLGERRAEIRAPVAGLLSGIRRQPLLYEGDLIARLQTRARRRRLLRRPRPRAVSERRVAPASVPVARASAPARVVPRCLSHGGPAGRHRHGGRCYPLLITISVISAGANKRIAGPQKPVPRLT
jgi:hypothetical protein